MGEMKKEDLKLIYNLSVIGAIFAILFGSILHFCYQWSGNNFIVGLFAPINESVWEHMKLVFTPLLLFAFIDWTLLKSKVKNYCFALMKEVGIAIIFILAVFYSYTAIFGHSVLAIDILSFVISIVLAKWFGYLILTGRFKSWEFNGLNTISAIILIGFALFFVSTTINPPRAGLFKDPVTGTYGIYQST